ncbi:MAG TPA: hypothetical protein VN088_16225 [Nocardioides sp.]|nr:hypothetical protein [Nocardioides sp.]
MADPLDIITLADAKAFLNETTSDNDAEIAQFITACTPLIEQEIGAVVPRTVTTDIFPNEDTGLVTVPVGPVLSITSAAMISDGSALDISQWYDDDGILRTKDGSGLPVEPFSLTMSAGREPVPENIQAGLKEVLRLAWASQRMAEPPAFLLSYRAQTWLGPSATALGFA